MSSFVEHHPSWFEDRFVACLLLAIVMHALLVLGLRFGFDLTPPPRLAETLDVVLVNWKSEEAPEEADYLAQASQQGGGEFEEKTRPSEPVSGQAPSAAEGEDPVESSQTAPVPEQTQREIVAVEAPADEVVQVNTIEQPDTEQPSAAQLMRQSMSMASLKPELRRERQFRSELPRREFISANTREYEYAAYMNAWVAKVERVGNMNYPTELRSKGLYGDLVLMVGIKRDGSVESIDLMRSSGVAEIDQAAIEIVELAAPYSPLPDFDQPIDVLHITRTWRFESGFGVD